jgi:hypothetical protein
MRLVPTGIVITATYFLGPKRLNGEQDA